MLVQALVLTVGGEAWAQTVRTNGGCSDGSLWEMDARAVAGGRVEVEFDAETFVAGETWVVEFYQNGTMFATTQRVTRGSDGDFWVERTRRDRAGVDVFEVYAENLVTGEVCDGRLQW